MSGLRRQRFRDPALRAGQLPHLRVIPKLFPSEGLLERGLGRWLAPSRVEATGEPAVRARPA